MTNFRRQARVAALMCAVAATGACDQLLEVDLPSAITADALDDPSTAALQVNSIIGAVECAYSALVVHASGAEDNFQRVAGSGPAFSQYIDTPSGGDCDTGNWDDSFVENLVVARSEGYRAYNQILGGTVANKERLLAQLAMYNTITLGVFGEYFCEFAISTYDRVSGGTTFGTLMTPTQTLDLAEDWTDSVFVHLALAAAGDTLLSTTAGVITSNVGTTTRGLRARIRYANGDLAGAAADAATIPDGHVAWVLREDPEDRRNAMALVEGNANGVQAQGFLQGPVTVGVIPGISELGAHPVAGTPYAGGWPNPVPFTGYLNLAIETATGRAVSDVGYPLTTGTGMTADSRIPFLAAGNVSGGPRPVQRKYTTLAADIPLLNWREMRLIRAEAAGPSVAGVDHVNAVRAQAGLPLVAGAYRTLVESDADRYDDLIIEERRRALWLEARFWSTKIQKNEKLWFPRRVGEWVNNSNYELNGGVRVLMPNNEYEINPNFGRSARGTGCSVGERPVFN
ncbi:MAG: hypothetical protein ABL963_02750 [Longimicrobiales bacterium]